LFEGHEIPAIPFKGPALAFCVYRNIALRQFGDLDILVPRQNVLRAKSLLLSQGYEPLLHLTPGQERSLLRSHCEYELVQMHSGLCAEIHWRFSPRHFLFPLDYEQVRERLEPAPLFGVRTQTLSPEDLLLVLCAHGAKHLWERLMWICDVAELIRTRKGINWGSVIEKARSLGSERMLFLGLLLANSLLEAPLPKEVLHEINASSSLRSLAWQVQKWLFSETSGIAGIWKLRSLISERRSA